MARRSSSSPIICCPGKPVRPGTVFDALRKRLEELGAEVLVEFPNDARDFRVEAWAPGSLVVHRGLRPPLLARLSQLEEEGWTCINRTGATAMVNRRDRVMESLREAGLPVPEIRMVGSWEEVRRVAARRPVVVKSADGSFGRGSRVLFSASGMPEAMPFPPPFIVEDHVGNDGWDRKLYVAGAQCFGLRKRWPRSAAAKDGVLDVGPELRDIARAAGAALGLEIYGVDVLVGAGGPTIVDVNPFPSFSGVRGGVEAVARHLLRRAGGG